MSSSNVEELLASIDDILGETPTTEGQNDTKNTRADKAQDGIKSTPAQSPTQVPDNTLPTPEPAAVPASSRVRIIKGTAGSLPPPGQTIQLSEEDRPTRADNPPQRPAASAPVESHDDTKGDDALDDIPEEEDEEDAPAPLRLRPPRSRRETIPQDDLDNAPRNASNGERGALAALAPRRLQQPFWRWLAYNGTAAAAGSAIGLTSYLSLMPPAAEWSAGAVLGTASAIALGYIMWWLVTTTVIARFTPLLGQIAAILIAAEVGRRSGEIAVTAIAPYAAQYAGLTYQETALLVVAAGLCGPTGFLVWRLRYHNAIIRWLARIPLVSSVLACALYAPGIV